MFDLLSSLSQIKTWWQNKRRERAEALRVERKYVVDVDENKISIRHPGGEVQTIEWDAVQSIAIRTNDRGPWAPDFWWVLEGGEDYCTWPQGATGEKEAKDQLVARFPDLNHEVLLMAYGSTDNAHFVCWER